MAILEGFWTADIAATYWAELFRAAETIAVGGARVRYLIDARRLGVQSQSVVDFNSRAAADAQFTDAKVAFVVEGALLGRQASRIRPGVNHRAFKGIEEARRWLIE